MADLLSRFFLRLGYELTFWKRKGYLHGTTRLSSQIKNCVYRLLYLPESSSEFFICLGEQPELDFGGKRNPDGQGFAAFGKVIEGMDVVKKIQSQPQDGQYLLTDVRILNIKRSANSKNKEE